MSDVPPSSNSCPPSEDTSSSSSDSAPGVLLFALSAAAAAAILTYVFKPTSPPPRSSSILSPAAISALARLYISLDPDPQTRSLLQSHLSNLGSDELRTRLSKALDSSSRLCFGTAGVRAAVGLGYDRLNVLTVVGLAQAVYVAMAKEQGKVVIGYDGRPDSEKFAIVIASVMESKGIQVMLFEKCAPTPLVAYAVRVKGGVGICVTASHNPRPDNGIKVFGTDGVQIGPDAAAAIEKAWKVNSKPWTEVKMKREQLGDMVLGGIEELEQSYYQEMKQKLCRGLGSKGLRVAYTACHGVGWPFVARIMREFGLEPLIPVKEQCDIDGTFPTLPFPNPEERGALDLAVKTAKENDCQIVLANDPDADRLGVAEVNGGNVKVLTGNEIATLFADYLTGVGREKGLEVSNCVVVASTVSSKVTASMARSRGFGFVETLTGFKWLNKKAVELEKSGKEVVLTYEEALGYNVTANLVRDKDGVTAAAVFVEMAADLYRKGKTLAKRLDELVDECGVHLSKNGYVRTTEKATTKQVFDNARKQGLPEKLGQSVVKSVRDLTLGIDSAEHDGKSQLPGDATSQFITFRCARVGQEEETLIIHLRGSGTEPKIKYYSELRCSREEHRNGTGQAYLDAAVRDAVDTVLKPKHNGLSGWAG